MDPDFRRLRYVRYADDFLLGFAGPKDEAEEIKAKIGEFLNESLKLELSPQKTLITHAGTEDARFLGHDIGAIWGRRVKNKLAAGKIRFRVPLQKLEEKVAKYARDGKPTHRPELLGESDFTIVETYGSEYRGYVQFYTFADNRFWLDRLRWYMETSLLMTLAHKHKSTVTKMVRKYQAETYHRGKTLRCIEVRVERPDKGPLTARFGGLRLTPDPFLAIIDLPMDGDRRRPTGRRNELLARVLADECELCGSRDDVQVHHIRKLADLKVKGRREKPAWERVMISRRRKTLVVCKYCHDAIHAGRPTRKRGVNDGAENPF